MGNRDAGILIIDASANIIDGTAASRANVIAASEKSGISIQGGLSRINRVAGNYIGTDFLGYTALSNANGLLILDGSRNVIGGTKALARNIISGNALNGISLGGALATENLVQGNFVGTVASGEFAFVMARTGF